MLVGAIAGVDDAGVQALREEEGRAGGGVAEDDKVGVERLDVPGGVLERLALGDARGLGGDVQGIGREALGGELEGNAGARARLHEKAGHRLAPKGGDLLDRAGGDLLERGRGVEDGDDLLGGEFLDRKEMTSGPAHGWIFSIPTSSTPSSSDILTLICSMREVGEVLPT